MEDSWKAYTLGCLSAFSSSRVSSSRLRWQPLRLGAALGWSMQSILLPLSKWHGSVLCNFFIATAVYILWIVIHAVFQQMPEQQCSHLNLPVLRLPVHSPLSTEWFKVKPRIWIFFYTSHCFTLWVFSQSTECFWVVGSSTWFYAFFRYAFKCGSSSVFCPLLLKGGRNLFTWTSVSVSALPSVKCSSDLRSWWVLIMWLEMSNTGS